MKIVFIGDIVGKAAREIFINKLDQSRELLDDVINTDRFAKYLKGSEVTYRQIVENFQRRKRKKSGLVALK